MPNSIEHQSHQYSSPSLLRRFAAMVYDTLLLMAISIAYGAVAVAINVTIQGAPEMGQKMQWGQARELVFLGWLACMIFFFCYFWHKSGQTLGMKTWHMKVLNEENHQHPSYQQSLLRCCLAIVSFLLFGFGYFYMYLNTERKTLHDKLSKTRLVLTKPSPQPSPKRESSASLTQ
jgi:uncharacterized RDD family membrane protein YckC